MAGKTLGKVLKVLGVTLFLLAVVPGLAWAMVVTNPPLYAKAIDQLNQLKQQLEVVTEARDTIDKTFTSIGKAASVTIPTINLGRLTGKLTNAASCLLPDYKTLFPNVDFKGIDLGSICEQRGVYQRALLFDESQFKDLTTARKLDIMSGFHKRRDALLSSSVIDALAQSDLALKQSKLTSKSKEEIAQRADRAKSLQERLAVLTQAQLATIEAINASNQLLAQLLKVNAALAMKMGVPVSLSEQAKTTKDQGGQS